MTRSIKKAITVMMLATLVCVFSIVAFAAEGFTVTFDKATSDTVTGMPESMTATGEIQLSDYAPSREGYNFAGWVKDINDEVSLACDTVTSDTTYYALWVKGMNYEFTDSDYTFSHVAMSTDGVDTEKGTITFTTTGTDPLISMKNVGLYGGQYPVIEVRLKTTAVGNNIFQVYFTSKDANGNYLGLPYGYNGDSTDYVYNGVTVSYAAYTDEYVTVSIDMSSRSDWAEGYIDTLRLDPLTRSGAQLEIDYIRLVNYEASVIEVDGIDVPVAKAAADTEAASLSDRVDVKSVTWSPALLADCYFDGDTEYTVAVTVESTKGCILSNAPLMCKINGEKADSYTYDASSGNITLYKKFPATEDVGNVVAHNIYFEYKNESLSPETDKEAYFENDVIKLSELVPSAVPKGCRWIGWSDTEEGEALDSYTVAEDKIFYALYEEITEFDFSNPYHRNGVGSITDSALRFENNHVVVTPVSSSDDGYLSLYDIYLDAYEYGTVRVYCSRSHTSEHDGVSYDNIFAQDRVPAAYLGIKNDTIGYVSYTFPQYVSVTTIDEEEYLVYIYYPAYRNGWQGNIEALHFSPYEGYPEFAIRKVEFLPNKKISDPLNITITAPETFTFPADTAVVATNNRAVSRVEWTPSDEFYENGEFLPEKEYTVALTVKYPYGCIGAETVATVNGNEAAIVHNEDYTTTVTYTFPATQKAEDVNVAISGKNVISEPNTQVQLTANVTLCSDGSAAPSNDVIWSIDDTSVAEISQDGVVTPNMNGTATVKAVSYYNPEFFATTQLIVTNHPPCKVTFDKNTTDTVTGMPDSVMVRGNYVPNVAQPEREGYFFIGWSVDEDAVESDESFCITEDTTLYAKWGKGYVWNCNDASDILKVPYNRTVTYKDGIAHLSSGSSAIVIEDYSLYSKKISTADYNKLQIKLSVPSSGYLKTYTQSTNGSGSTSPWNESAASTIYNLLANNSGEFQVVTFDYSSEAYWNMYEYINIIRIDSNIAKSGEIAIDWIRLVDSKRIVKLDGNGGGVKVVMDGDGGYYYADSSEMNCELGDTIYIDDPVREGYRFLGWSKNPESTEKLYKDNSFTISDDVTLYAMWELDDAAFNVQVEELPDGLESAVVVLAIYDENGVFEKMITQKVTPENLKANFDIDVSKYYSYQIMVFEDLVSFKPISESRKGYFSDL